jgi:hypothetical protein
LFSTFSNPGYTKLQNNPQKNNWHLETVTS